MSKRLTDQAARDRIVTELDRSLLVEAGAGSGKTHQMAARMAAGVASGVYAVDHMAAVTFTRKAAAELRGRFHLALEDLLKNTTDAERRARIRHALTNLERLFTGTIHGFCARLLRERPIEAGVAPGFGEVDEIDDELQRRQSWRDYRSEARAAGDPDLALLAAAGIHGPDLDKAFETFCVYEDVEFPAVDVPPPDGTHVWKKLDAFWKDIAARLPKPIPEETKCRTHQAAAIFQPQWAMAASGRRSPAALADLLGLWNFEPNVTLKYWSTDGKVAAKIAREAKAIHAAFRAEVVQPYLAAWRQHLYAPCVRILSKARHRAADDRRQRNVASFNDLLMLTLRVLRDNTSVREALQQKYRHIFVDEFQDTDPIQAELILLLQAGSSLFVVGDPKQSIYRFRRADIAIYNEVRAKLAGADGRGVVALTTNFRSVPGVCDWANNVFQSRFPGEPTEWQAKFAPLVPKRSSGDAPAVLTLTIPASPESGDVARDEAFAIARYIRAEVMAGRRSFEDFLILTRKRKALQPYAKALEALRIPTEVSGAGGFGDSVEVRALADLLAALADPQDAVALVGVLRGPLFGLSDVELYAYRRAGGTINIFSELPNVPAPVQAVASALESLRRWYRWTRMLPAGAALDRVLEDSGCLALAAASPGGVEAGDLLHAVDRVRAEVEAGFTLAEAAEALLDEDLESSEVESLPLEPGRPGVVRLMNLHKAKGLEAPVVFLANPTGAMKKWAVESRIVRIAGMAPQGYLKISKASKSKGWGPPKDLAEPTNWAGHEALEQPFLDAELDRLLYVAATRAKDVLIVGRWAGAKRDERRAWSVLDDHLDGLPELKVPAPFVLPADADVDLSASGAHTAARIAEGAHAAVRKPSWATTSVTAEAKRLPRVFGRAGDDGEADDPTRVVTMDTPSRRADAGAAWGSLVHGLLEHAVRHKASTKADLERLALWLTMEEPHLRGVIERAVETVLAVVASESLAAARAATESHAEVPFATRTMRDGLPTVVTGAIDLVHRAGGGWRVVDYKTDTDVAGAAANPAYAAQVKSYAEAWEKVSGGAVTSEIVSAR